jgi:hypothetical protein
MSCAVCDTRLADPATPVLALSPPAAKTLIALDLIVAEIQGLDDEALTELASGLSSKARLPMGKMPRSFLGRLRGYPWMAVLPEDAEAFALALRLIRELRTRLPRRGCEHRERRMA